MDKPLFNHNDAKYKCFLDLLHVKTGGIIICALILVYHLQGILNNFDVNFLVILFFCLALYGIIYSKEGLLDYAIFCHFRIRLFYYGALVLFFNAILIFDNMATPVERFCRHLVEKIGHPMDSESLNFVFGTLLHHYAFQLLFDYLMYDILKRCRQYIIDKAAYDKFTQSQANNPPAYQD